MPVAFYVTKHDPKIDLGIGTGRAAGDVITLRASDVAVRPKKGDRIAGPTASYVVRDVEVDALAGRWLCDVDRLP